MEMERSTSSLRTPRTRRARDIDLLLKDVSERKQSFRRNVESLVAELKEVRSCHSVKEQTCANEIQTRQELEDKAKSMAEEITTLKEMLEERNGQLNSSHFAAEKYLMELDNIRSQLSFTQASADESATSAESAHLQCRALQQELHETNNSLKEQECIVKRSCERLESIRKDHDTRELSQKQLKEEVMRVEHDIMQALAKAEANKERELRKILDEDCPRINLIEMNKVLTSKDEEVKGLKDEMKTLSAHSVFKTKELESQVEKYRKSDQELRKRVLKLEFCVKEVQSKTRKLQRAGDLRDNAIKELRDQIATKRHDVATTSDARGKKSNFWESSSFKVMFSMSMVILVAFSNR